MMNKDENAISKVPKSYFQGLELQKNPYYKNINTSSVRLEPIKNKEENMYTYFVNKFLYLKKSIFG